MNQFFPGETAAEWAKKIEKALQSDGVPDTSIVQSAYQTGDTPVRMSAHDEDTGQMPELLKMSNRDGSTVAHALASERRLPERFITPEILALTDRDGNAVVHILAEQGDLPEKYFTWKWLSLKNNDGWMAAHSAAWQGKLPAKFVTAEILELEGESGWITGNILLQRGNFPPEMLTVKFLEKPSFLIQLVFCFKYKDPEDRIQYAGCMPTESLEYIIRNEDILKIEGSECLINAVKEVLERTASTEAFERAGSEECDYPCDLYR